MTLLAKTAAPEFFDFNCKRRFCQYSAAFHFRRKAADEYWSNHLFAAHGLFPSLRFSSLRGSLPGEPLRQELLLQRSVPLLGVCPAHVSREPARHRSLPACATVEALPHGLSQSGFSRYSSRRQRTPRLAHLPRFRARLNLYCSPTLSGRTSGHRFCQCGLRVRFHDDRPVSHLVSVGAVSPTQKRRQTPYAVGRAGQHSHQCLRDGRPRSRRQPAGRTDPGTRGVLLARPRVPGFCPPVSDHPSGRLLCYPGQGEHSVLSASIATDRQIRRHSLRSDDHTHRAQDLATVSQPLAPGALLRRRKGLASHLSDQQLSSARPDHRATLSRPLASGTVLSLDQTASSDQGLLWHLGERGEDPSLGGALDLFAGSHPEKAPWPRLELAQNSPNSQHLSFRKNPAFRGFSRVRTSTSGTGCLHPIANVRLITGHY